MSDKYLAVLDIGSNSSHMIIGEVTGPESFKVIDREKSVLRLAARNSAGKPVIDPVEADRAVNIVLRCRTMAEMYGAKLRIVTTSAVREAINREEFIERIYRETGQRIEIIDGHTEARFIYLGVIHYLPFKKEKVLCVDIGGGSTEITVGENGRPQFVTSLRMGSVRLSKMFFTDYIVTGEGIAKCREYISRELSYFTGFIKNMKYDYCAGSAGTVKSVLTMNEERKRFCGTDRISRKFTAEDLDEIAEVVLSNKTPGERMEIPGLEPKRSDVIIGGILVLKGLFDELGIMEMIYSDYALREGTLLDTLYKNFSKINVDEQ